MEIENCDYFTWKAVELIMKNKIKQAKQEVYDKLDNIPMESYTFTEYKKIKENDLGKETKGVNTNQERNS